MRIPAGLRELLGSRTGRLAAGCILALAFGVVVAMAVLWPDGSSKQTSTDGFVQQTYVAEVTAVSAKTCDLPSEYESDTAECLDVQIELLGGPNKGKAGEFTFDDVSKQPDVGDKIRVIENPTATPDQSLAGDDELGAGGQDPAIEQDLSGGDSESTASSYSFVGFERSSTMLWLLVLFIVAALAVSRMRAAMSLIGLAASLVVVIVFIVPAILDGRPPVAVAVVGSLAVMLITMILAHGVGLKSVSAAIGTTAALLITILLAYVFTEAAHLTGYTSDETAFLQASGGHLSLTGLVLAGIVIAALGVLDDLTVTQASAVLALRRENPSLSAAGLYRRALDIGHDHIAATINTLVLAYVGASLPILLVFSIGDVPFSQTINSEVIAEPIVATLVGSIGLIAAVPVTTGLAALLAVRLPPQSIAEGVHAH